MLPSCNCGCRKRFNAQNAFILLSTRLAKDRAELSGAVFNDLQIVVMIPNNLLFLVVSELQ